jgi:hypothetical protein
VYSNRFRRGVFVPALALLSLVSSAFAQTSRGTVSGVVTDATGAAVVGATVDLVHRQTNVSRSTETNAAGLYRFDAVDLGPHDVSVRMAGFKNATIRSFEVAGGQVVTVDVRLEVGETQTSVEVTASAVQIQAEAPVRGANITTSQITELPISERNPVALALNLPGISTNRYGTGVDTFVVNGARGRSNNFLLDGTENNDISVAGQGFQVRNPDAVAEVHVQTSNFDAEFGRAGGGVINVITRQGTNSLHGSLNYTLDSTIDDALTNTQALNPEAIQRGRPLPGTEQWYGGTIGGPIVKDRTFFFGSFQEQRQNASGSANVTVPSAAGRATLQRLFPRGRSRNLDTFFDLIGPLEASSQPFNVALGDGRPDVEFGTASFAFPQTLVDRQFLVRIDHKISDKDQLSGRWARSKLTEPSGGETTSVPGLFTSSSEAYQNALINHTRVFTPTLTNELRLSYNRLELDSPMDPANPAGLTASQYTIQGISQAWSLGVRSNFPQGRIANNYVVQDTMTKIAGRHTLRFGLDLLQQRSRQFAPIVERGRFNYNASNFGGVAYTAFANFVDDFAGAGGALDRTFGSARYYPELFRQAYFFQDRWRATQALTISLGLRWEDFGTPINSIAKASWSGLFNVDPVTFDGPYRQPSKVKRDLNNFSPMVGIAYSPSATSGLLGWLFGERKGVFRMGYGIGYDSFFNNIASNAQTSVPNAIAMALPASVVSAAQPRGVANLSTLMFTTPREPRPADGQALVPGDLVNPYYQRWSAGLQREIPANVLLDVSYVASKGTKLFLNEQLNPTVPISEMVLPLPASQIPADRITNRLDGLQGSRNIRTNGGDSIYHSLQVSANRRLTAGLQATLAYTWSKLIDNGADIFQVAALNQTQNPSVPAYLGGLQRDRSVSMLDRPHRATITYVYNLPFLRDGKGVLGRVLGGWQLSGVTSFESGPPVNITNGVDADGYDGAGDRPDFNPNGRRGVRAVPNPASPTGYVNPDAGNQPIDRSDAMFVGLPAFAGTVPRRTGNLGRNTWRMTGVNNFDMTLQKRFAVTESVSLEFRAESFNVFNHPQYGVVGESPFAPKVEQGMAAGVNTAPAGRFLRPEFSDGGARMLRYSLRLRF